MKIINKRLCKTSKIPAPICERAKQSPFKSFNQGIATLCSQRALGLTKPFNRHSEWIVFLTGLILMGTMNPYSVGTSWCLIDFLGFTYCPGEGLGHSIAFLFRGEIINSLEANLMGPFVVVGLSFRIIQIWKNLITKNNSDLMENYHV